MQVFVRTNGKTIIINVRSSDTVDYLKEKVQEKEDKQLMNGHKLSDYKIGELSTPCTLCSDFVAASAATMIFTSRHWTARP